MTKQSFPKTISLTLGVLTMAFLISIAVLAWTEPTVGPPGSNVDAPLNIGSSDQIKQGGLTIGATSGVIRIGSGAYQLAKDGLSLAFKNNAGTTKMIIGDNGNVDIEGLLTIDNGGGDALVIEKGGDLVIYNSDNSGSAKFYVDNDGEIITPNKLKVGGDLEVSGGEICLADGCISSWSEILGYIYPSSLSTSDEVSVRNFCDGIEYETYSNYVGGSSCINCCSGCCAGGNHKIYWHRILLKFDIAPIAPHRDKIISAVLQVDGSYVHDASDITINLYKIADETWTSGETSASDLWSISKGGIIIDSESYPTNPLIFDITNDIKTDLDNIVSYILISDREILDWNTDIFWPATSMTIEITY